MSTNISNLLEKRLGYNIENIKQRVNFYAAADTLEYNFF